MDGTNMQVRRVCGEKVDGNLMDYLAIAKMAMVAMMEHDRIYQECTCANPPDEQPSQCWYRLSHEQQQEAIAEYVARQLELNFG